jgi:hypothetical protein
MDRHRVGACSLIRTETTGFNLGLSLELLSLEPWAGDPSPGSQAKSRLNGKLTDGTVDPPPPGGTWPLRLPR